MSTRAAVAYIPKNKKSPNHWVGIYSHFDGYPSGLGAKIWEKLHKEFLDNKGEIGVSNDGDPTKAIQAFIDVYIKGHKAGWSSFGEVCYCHDPSFVIRDGLREYKLDSEKSPDPLFIEYVYVIDPGSKTMQILSSHFKPDDQFEKSEPDARKSVPKLEDGYWDYGHCQVKHVPLAVVDLLGEEPNWEKLEGSDEEE